MLPATFPPGVPLHHHPDGEVRLVGTRLGLVFFARLFRAGETPEAIARDYPSPEVTPESVRLVRAYCEANRAAVDEYVAGAERRCDELMKEVEARPGYRKFDRAELKRRWDRLQAERAAAGR